MFGNWFCQNLLCDSWIRLANALDSLIGCCNFLGAYFALYLNTFFANIKISAWNFLCCKGNFFPTLVNFGTLNWFCTLENLFGNWFCQNLLCDSWIRLADALDSLIGCCNFLGAYFALYLNTFFANIKISTWNFLSFEGNFFRTLVNLSTLNWLSPLENLFGNWFCQNLLCDSWIGLADAVYCFICSGNFLGTYCTFNSYLFLTKIQTIRFSHYNIIRNLFRSCLSICLFFNNFSTTSNNL